MADRPLMCLFWRALDYSLTLTRLCVLDAAVPPRTEDVISRKGTFQDALQSAGTPPITYVDHAAGHGAEFFENIWDIGAERIVSNRQ